MSFFLVGLFTGLSLIVAIGAQNAYLLRLGLSEPARIVAPAVLLCIASDAALIIAGVAGMGVLTARVPWLLTVLQWLGVTWLILSLIHISEPTRRLRGSRMPSSA